MSSRSNRRLPEILPASACNIQCFALDQIEGKRPQNAEILIGGARIFDDARVDGGDLVRLFRRGASRPPHRPGGRTSGFPS
jgi:hypothetical protein